MNLRDTLFRPTLTSEAQLIFRLAVGGWLAYFGYNKTFGDLSGFATYVSRDLGLPAFLGYAAAFTELIGGVLIVLGCLTRPAALAALVTMLVAAFVGHGADPFPKKEHALIYAASALLLMATGAGKYSVDEVLRSVVKRGEPA
jgi:putative oxidoreductase